MREISPLQSQLQYSKLSISPQVNTALDEISTNLNKLHQLNNALEVYEGCVAGLERTMKQYNSMCKPVRKWSSFTQSFLGVSAPLSNHAFEMLVSSKLQSNSTLYKTIFGSEGFGNGLGRPLPPFDAEMVRNDDAWKYNKNGVGFIGTQVNAYTRLNGNFLAKTGGIFTPDAHNAFLHYLHGNGEDYYFSLNNLYVSDTTIQGVLNVERGKIQKLAKEHYVQTGEISFQVVSPLRNDQSSQKSSNLTGVNSFGSLGGYSAYSVANVTVGKDGTFQMLGEVRTVDRYNFDKTATGLIEKELNNSYGPLAESGDAKPFNSFGTLPFYETWK